MASTLHTAAAGAQRVATAIATKCTAAGSPDASSRGRKWCSRARCRSHSKRSSPGSGPTPAPADGAGTAAKRVRSARPNSAASIGTRAGRARHSPRSTSARRAAYAASDAVQRCATARTGRATAGEQRPHCRGRR